MQSRTRRACVGVALVAVLAAVATAPALATHAGAAGPASNYLVVYKSQSVPSDAAAAIRAAGGSLVDSYGKIGVAVASSSSSASAGTPRSGPKTEAVASTGRLA